MFLLPYSPRWLAKQGRTEEAKATLFRLHGGRKNAREDIVQSEFEEMLDQIRWGACFGGGSRWKNRELDLISFAMSRRGGEPDHQLQRFGQQPCQHPSNSLWMSRPGHVPVSERSCARSRTASDLSFAIFRWTGVNVK